MPALVRLGPTAVLGISLLACSGVGGGGGSEHAQSMCDHFTRTLTLDTPCQTLAAGSIATISGYEVQVTKVAASEGKDSLPAIKNSTERARMKKVDRQTLVVEASFKNIRPVKNSDDFGMYVINGDGDTVLGAPYNTTLYNQGNDGWMVPLVDRVVGPGKTRNMANVYPMKHSSLGRTLLVLRKQEKRPDPQDPRGRKKLFINELIVMDLDPPM